MEEGKYKKQDVDLMNKILTNVSERLFYCHVVSASTEQPDDESKLLHTFPVKGVAQEESKVYFVKNSGVDEFFLFPFMMEAVKECMEHIFMTTYKSFDIIKGFTDEIYEKTCEKFRKLFKQKLHIDVDDIIWLSSLAYEGEAANGNVCFALDKISDMEIGIQIEDKQHYVLLNEINWRQLRKWLEVTRDEESCPLGALFVYDDNNWMMKGFSCISSCGKRRLRVHFIRHMVWELYQGDKLLVKYDGGRYFGARIDEKDEFAEKIEKVLDEQSDATECVECLWPLVEEAKGQKHGTSLVVLLDEGVEKEIERICENSVGIRVTEHDNKNKLIFVRHLTAVDGALIVDKAGNILAYGVILDSKSGHKAKRDASRGSRYQAVRDYIVSRQEAKEKAIVVIVSEDGMINFYSTYDAEKEQNEKKDGNRY